MLGWCGLRQSQGTVTGCIFQWSLPVLLIFCFLSPGKILPTALIPESEAFWGKENQWAHFDQTSHMSGEKSYGGAVRWLEKVTQQASGEAGTPRKSPTHSFTQSHSFSTHSLSSHSARTRIVTGDTERIRWVFCFPRSSPANWKCRHINSGKCTIGNSETRAQKRGVKNH